MLAIFELSLLVCCALCANATPIFPRYTNVSSVIGIATTTYTTSMTPGSSSTGSDSSSALLLHATKTPSDVVSSVGPTASAFGEGVLAANGGMDWSYLTVAHTTLVTATYSHQHFSYSPSSATAAAQYSSVATSKSYSAPAAFTNNTQLQPEPTSTTILYLTETVWPTPTGSSIAELFTHPVTSSTGTPSVSASSSALSTVASTSRTYLTSTDETRGNTFATSTPVSHYTTKSAGSSSTPVETEQSSRYVGQPIFTTAQRSTYSLQSLMPNMTSDTATRLGYHSIAFTTTSIETRQTSSEVSSTTRTPTADVTTLPISRSSAPIYSIPTTMSSSTDNDELSPPMTSLLATYSKSPTNEATFSATSSSVNLPVIATELPQIVTGHQPNFSSLLTSSSGQTSSQVSQTTTSTAMAGITIVPVNPYTNALTVTITVTDPGVTTTVTAAGPTVTVTAV